MREEKQNSIWKKLCRKPSAVVAIAFIALTILVAVFAYVLAPDASPNANRMMVELGAKKPGFSKQLLLLPKAKTSELKSGSFWSGTEDQFTYLPINNYRFETERIIVTHFIDDELQDTLVFNFNQILPIEIQKKSSSEKGIIYNRIV